MAVEIRMPRFGMTMKKGKLSRWLKREGERVRKGEPLFEVETEKITNTVESIASGILFQILVREGETVPVGTVLAILAEEGERPEQVGRPRAEEVEVTEQALASEPGSGQEPAVSARGYVPATPAAKRLAKELGIDLARVTGTGKDGRITEGDVRRTHEQGKPAARITPLAEEMARKEGMDLSGIEGTGEGGKITREDVERMMASARGAMGERERAARSIPFAGIRRAIGENMHASLQNTAQLTLFTEVDVSELVELRGLLRQEYEKGGEEGIRVSYNDLLVYITARVLKRFPIMNSTLVADRILLHDRVDIGIAVALPDGLIVPKVRAADRKDLRQIAREARDLARRAREGALSPDEVVDGTFTITNLGGLGVDGFTPILNPPETAILGVGRVVERPAVYKGRIAVRSFMTLSLTIDHRVVDGAPAAEFLQALARHLEHPGLLVA